MAWFTANWFWVLIFIAFIVGVFYCLDALHSERRDRSILFCTSLPVSDLTTVLSKASIPFAVLPLLTFAITVVLQFAMLLLSTAILWASGLNVAMLWRQLSFFQMSLLLFYHLLTVHTLWHAPIYGWSLLVSSRARRAAYLWAALTLIAIGFVLRAVAGGVAAPGPLGGAAGMRLWARIRAAGLGVPTPTLPPRAQPLASALSSSPVRTAHSG